MRWFSVIACGALLCLSAPARAELVVNISKSQQRLDVVVDGAEAYRWPVSTGRSGYQTPSGTFRPIRLERHWYSHKYHMSPMPWSVFFHGGYAVHGTMEADNLGRVASHGCVRLRPDNASILYSLVRRHGAGNTRVVVMNGPLPPPAAAPGGVPMAKAEASPEQAPQPPIAKPLLAEDELHLSAKSHDAAREAPPDDEHALHDDAWPHARLAAAERRAIARGDDAQVLRQREAWLRSLDRKYGFSH